MELGAKSDVHRLRDRRAIEIPATTSRSAARRSSDNWQDHFLPQVGAVYDLTSREQIFASYSENLALATRRRRYLLRRQPRWRRARKRNAPRTLELGVRTNRATFNASFVVYSTRFQNRLQSFAAPRAWKHDHRDVLPERRRREGVRRRAERPVEAGAARRQGLL